MIKSEQHYACGPTNIKEFCDRVARLRPQGGVSRAALNFTARLRVFFIRSGEHERARIMTQKRIGIVCKNCHCAIQIPPQKETPILFACPSCGHVYEYELDRGMLGSLRPGLRYVICRCSDDNCKYPVAVYAVLSAEIKATVEWARRRAHWIFHGITCPFGHSLHVRCSDEHQGTFVDAA
jgi:hypothetical protein